MQTHRIDVDFHLLLLKPFDTNPLYLCEGAGTLIGVAEDPEHLIVVTGCASGPVRASLTAHLTSLGDAAPATPSGVAAWEAVEEVSLPVSRPLFWSSADSTLRPGDLPSEPAFVPAAPGPHRVRVSARGRNLAYDLVVAEPVEDYHLDVWPEPRLRDPEVLLRDRKPRSA